MMTRTSLVLAACLVALLSVTAVAEHDPSFSRAEFQFPELKAFFKEHVEKGDFDRVHMNYISGKPPELVLFDATGVEVERQNVEGKSVDELRTILTTYGFAEKGGDAKAEL